MTYLFIAAGMLVLLVGGELLVRHASRLSLSLGVSPLVVGLTVVAVGTSTPELMSSVYGQWMGQSALAVGNVVGSNIFNVFFILGLSALFAPLTVDTNLLRIEVPVVLAVSLLGLGFAYSGAISRWESGILLAILVVYTVWLVRKSRAETAESTLELDAETEAVAASSKHWSTSAGLVLVGLILVLLGGRIFVSGAVEVATSLGVDEGVIGLTVVAAGTSLPELVTSILASLRGHREIAVGNVVGSNLFNLTGVLGLAGMVVPGGSQVDPSLLSFDMVVMVAAMIVCLPVFFTGSRIDRWEGGVLVLYYLGYVTYRVLVATGQPAATPFRNAMIWFVVPLTLLTLGVVGHREWSIR